MIFSQKDYTGESRKSDILFRREDLPGRAGSKAGNLPGKHCLSPKKGVDLNVNRVRQT